MIASGLEVDSGQAGKLAGEEALNTFLSPAQEALKERYCSFALENLQPIASALESHEYPLKEFMQTLGQSGHLGLTVPEEYGGQAAPFINLVLLVEALAELEPGLGLSLAAHCAAIELIKRQASSNLKARYLPLLARGETIAAVAFGEETAGTDVQAIQSTLTRLNGEMSLSGKKTWVVNGQLAGLLLVLAHQDDSSGQAQASDKLGLAVVDMSASQSLAVSANLPRLGMRSAYVNHVEFKALPVSEENLLVRSSDGLEPVLYAMDVAKVVVAAAAIGLVKGALSQAADHARRREQFGRQIGQFQAIQWKLADMDTEHAAAQLMTYRAAWSKDEDPGQFRRNAAMCKWFATRAARFHSGEAVQILGASGVSSESPLERFYRDAKVMEICQGTSELQKLMLVEELGI